LEPAEPVGVDNDIANVDADAEHDSLVDRRTGRAGMVMGVDEGGNDEGARPAGPAPSEMSAMSPPSCRSTTLWLMPRPWRAEKLRRKVRPSTSRNRSGWSRTPGRPTSGT
jgi:hypothetical protein